VLSIFEEVKRPDRRRLDDLVLEIIGFAERQERTAVLDQLYEAVSELVRRRLNRSRTASKAECGWNTDSTDRTDSTDQNQGISDPRNPLNPCNPCSISPSRPLAESIE
jgi:hypothetical protein